MIKVLQFTDETLEEILSWSDSIEFIKAEGELLVDNSYVKMQQYVGLTSYGKVYKLGTKQLISLGIIEVQVTEKQQIGCVKQRQTIKF